jgi:hypothetical protein
LVLTLQRFGDLAEIEPNAAKPGART